MSTEIKIKSENLKVFPATRRTKYAYESRLISEESLARIVRACGDKNSYIIEDSFNVSTDTADTTLKILNCEFVIKGHYFDIKNQEISAEDNLSKLYVCAKFDDNELDIIDGTEYVDGVWLELAESNEIISVESIDGNEVTTVKLLLTSSFNESETKVNSENLYRFDSKYVRGFEQSGTHTQLGREFLPDTVFTTTSGAGTYITTVDGGEI